MNDFIEEKTKKSQHGFLENVGIGSAIVAGSTVSAVGVAAAGTGYTAAISTAGAAIGGTAGGIFGSRAVSF